MYYIWTAFDKTRGISKPLMTAVLNSETMKPECYGLYGYAPLDVVLERVKYIASLFDNEVVVNDFKSHLDGFNHPLHDLMKLDRDYKVNMLPEEEEITIPKEAGDLYKYLLRKILEAKKIGPGRWQQLLGDASLVYLTLQRRGVRRGGLDEHPTYELTTFTGRSKTTGFSIQGMTEEVDITHIDEDKKKFICIDWISADMRALSLLSGDKEMQRSFDISDPYRYIAAKTGGDRDTCKVEMLKSIYALNPNNKLLDIFPTLKYWISQSVEQMRYNGFATSLLGRKFYLNGDNERTVFNAPIQGTVAHAMHASMVRLHKALPRHLLTELHDSIILCSTPREARLVINEACEIMFRPFRDILPSNPTFPLTVSIGDNWRKWNKYREIREL